MPSNGGVSDAMNAGRHSRNHVLLAAYNTLAVTPQAKPSAGKGYYEEDIDRLIAVLQVFNLSDPLRFYIVADVFVSGVPIIKSRDHCNRLCGTVYLFLALRAQSAVASLVQGSSKPPPSRDALSAIFQCKPQPSVQRSWGNEQQGCTPRGEREQRAGLTAHLRRTVRPSKTNLHHPITHARSRSCSV